MSLSQYVDKDTVHNAMVQGLLDHIREALRERIMKAIEGDIEQAIDAAIDNFKIAIYTMAKRENMEEIIKIIVEKKNA